jgi:hypothetical protein
MGITKLVVLDDLFLKFMPDILLIKDYYLLGLNNNMSTSAVFLGIEKAFDTTWHLGLL